MILLRYTSIRIHLKKTPHESFNTFSHIEEIFQSLSVFMTRFLLWYLVLCNSSGNILKRSCCEMCDWVITLLCPLLLLTAVTCASLSSCGPLGHSQSQRRQRRVDQRSHRLADLLPAVCVDHPAARPAGPGLPAALPPLHPGPAQTGGQLRPSSCTKSSTPEPFISQLNVPVSLQKAFRTGTSTRLDDRVFSMSQLKYQPLVYSMLMIHPALYRVDDLTDEVRRCHSVDGKKKKDCF